MFDIGRICMKIAGRDSKKYCVVIEKIDDNYVMVDGETRRKKVNVKHLMPLNKKIDVTKNASHDKIVEAFNKLGLKLK